MHTAALAAAAEFVQQSRGELGNSRWGKRVLQTEAVICLQAAGCAPCGYKLLLNIINLHSRRQHNTHAICDAASPVNSDRSPVLRRTGAPAPSLRKLPSSAAGGASRHTEL